MNKRLRHLTPEQYVRTRWSGGETTQIAISPEGALYADRQFLWRISSATMEDQNSTLTALPDYDRLVAMEEGTLEMAHADAEPLLLLPYQVYRFDGGTPTVCSGTGRDFNLMLRKGACDGRMEAVQLQQGRSWPVGAAEGETVLFCDGGILTVTAQDGQIRLKAGESVCLSEGMTGTLTAETAAKCLICVMWAL